MGWAPAPATLDPGPILSKLEVPVLALHGAHDIDVGASRTRPSTQSCQPIRPAVSACLTEQTISCSWALTIRAGNPSPESGIPSDDDRLGKANGLALTWRLVASEGPIEMSSNGDGGGTLHAATPPGDCGFRRGRHEIGRQQSSDRALHAANDGRA